jgi:hypothetical protein
MDVHGATASGSLSPRQAAQMLEIRLDAVYGLIWAGKLKAEKWDGRWLVSQSGVEARVRNKAEKRAHHTAPHVIEPTEGELQMGDSQ